MPNRNLVRVYSDRKYVYTTMVRHQGTTVAFAMDDSRRIYYSVLNLDLGSRERGEIDSSYWADNPPLLTFPAEVTEVGFGAGETVGVPAVRSGGRAEVSGGELVRQQRRLGVPGGRVRFGAQRAGGGRQFAAAGGDERGGQEGRGDRGRRCERVRRRRGWRSASAVRTVTESRFVPRSRAWIAIAPHPAVVGGELARPGAGGDRCRA